MLGLGDAFSKVNVWRCRLSSTTAQTRLTARFVEVGPEGGKETTTTAILLPSCVIHLHNTAEKYQMSPYRLARRWKNLRSLGVIAEKCGVSAVWRRRLAGSCHPPATPLFRRTTFFSGGLQAADRDKAWLPGNSEPGARSPTRERQREFVEAWDWWVDCVKSAE